MFRIIRFNVRVHRQFWSSSKKINNIKIKYLTEKEYNEIKKENQKQKQKINWFFFAKEKVKYLAITPVSKIISHKIIAPFTKFFIIRIFKTIIVNFLSTAIYFGILTILITRYILKIFSKLRKN